VAAGRGERGGTSWLTRRVGGRKGGRCGGYVVCGGSGCGWVRGSGATAVDPLQETPHASPFLDAHKREPNFFSDASPRIQNEKRDELEEKYRFRVFGYRVVIKSAIPQHEPI